ncbi:MAG TPA: hypothetical protein VKZ60_08085 [Chloroflexota bacterium]|nr:hypothetical protein [Chloroflexota bacterium]
MGRRAQQKRARRTVALPASATVTPGQRRALAEAVHAVLADHTALRLEGLCWYYAVVGCVVANTLVGRPRYFVQAGSLWLHPTDPPEQRWVGMDARAGGLARREFHAWFVAPSQPVGAGRVAIDPARDEVVDLAARYYPDWARRFGRAWERPTPPFLWCAPRELPEWLRLAADAEATRQAQLTQAPPALQALVYELARAVLRRLPLAA